jgi:energy-coupling factor transporter ATP-binding protein EcfA2
MEPVPLLQDLLEWSQAAPRWQRDALRRLFVSDALEDADYDALILLLKAEAGALPEGSSVPVFNPLSAEHLPDPGALRAGVSLKGVSQLSNVGQIPGDRVLEFSPEGLTIVFGENGAGKSGYARVLKHVCRARRPGDILADAFAPDAERQVPSALVDYEVAGDSESFSWTRGGAQSQDLLAISVFDSTCSNSYLADEEAPSFQPYGLGHLQRLTGDVRSELDNRLRAEQARLDTDMGAFVSVSRTSLIGKYLSSFGPSSSLEDAFQFAQWTAAHQSELEALRRSFASVDRRVEITLLSTQIAGLQAFAQQITEVSKPIIESAVVWFKDACAAATEAGIAQSKAAALLRGEGEELLLGTGENLWKLMFLAAKAFAEEVVHPSIPYADGDDSVCVLCQQDVGTEAQRRLQRFSQFVEMKVSSDATRQQLVYQRATDKLKASQFNLIVPAVITDILTRLAENFSPRLEAYLTVCHSRHARMIWAAESKSWTEIILPDLPDLVADLEAVVFLLREELEALNKPANQAEQLRLRNEISELEARETFSHLMPRLRSVHAGMVESAALTRSQNLLRQTTRISQAVTRFSREYVTEGLARSVNSEIQCLGLSHVTLEVNTRTLQGQPRCTLRLVGSNLKPSRVLSEGEQRVTGLAFFLSELVDSGSKSGLVFDDPVSSLDHHFRAKVAQRLAAESTKRQVVVFTHDPVFLVELSKAIGASPVLYLHLAWHSGSPGGVFKGRPWQQQRCIDRITSLELRCDELQRVLSPYPGDEERRILQSVYDDLRATIERLVEEQVVNGAVRRFDNYVKVSALKALIEFNQEDFQELEAVYQLCGDDIRGHDAAALQGRAAPTLSTLRRDVAEVRRLFEKFRSRKKR